MEGPEEGPAKTGAPMTCWRFRRSGDGSSGWDGRRGLIAPVVLGVRASTGGPPLKTTLASSSFFSFSAASSFSFLFSTSSSAMRPCAQSFYPSHNFLSSTLFSSNSSFSVAIFFFSNIPSSRLLPPLFLLFPSFSFFFYPLKDILQFPPKRLLRSLLSLQILHFLSSTLPLSLPPHVEAINVLLSSPFFLPLYLLPFPSLNLLPHLFLQALGFFIPSNPQLRYCCCSSRLFRY